MKKPDQDALPLGYEQPDLRDRLLAFLLGAGVTALLALTASDALAPQVWEESAVAAGLMPPETVAPGVARAHGGEAARCARRRCGGGALLPVHA